MSRKISDLQVPFREQAQHFKSACSEKNLEVLIYCTRRTPEEQARLYRQGRTLAEIELKATEIDKKYHRPDLAEILLNAAPQKSKNIITWAGPGQSLHNYGAAFDGCPMRDGKPVWGTRQTDDMQLWQRYGKIAEGLGLTWAGNWPERKREFPHVQQTNLRWQDFILTLASGF